MADNQASLEKDTEALASTNKELAATVRVIKDSTVNDVVCIAGVLVFREMGCLDDCEVVPAPS